MPGAKFQLDQWLLKETVACAVAALLSLSSQVPLSSGCPALPATPPQQGGRPSSLSLWMQGLWDLGPSRPLQTKPWSWLPPPPPGRTPAASNFQAHFRCHLWPVNRILFSRQLYDLHQCPCLLSGLLLLFWTPELLKIVSSFLFMSLLFFLLFFHS